MAEPAASESLLPVKSSEPAVNAPTATAIIEARPGPPGAGPTVSLVASAAAATGSASTEADDRRETLEPLGGVALLSAAAYGCIVTAVWIVIFAIGATVNSQPFRDVLARYATASVGVAIVPATASAPAGGTPAADGGVAPGAPAQTASLGPPPSFLQAFGALGVVAVSYTPTNLAILCSFAALIGCLGQIATVTRRAGRARAAAAEGGANRVRSSADDAGASKPIEAVAPPSPIDVTLRNSIGAVTWGFFVYLVVTSGTIVFTGDPFQHTSPEQYIRLAGAASLLAFVVGWRPELLGDMLAKVTASRIGTGQK